MAEPESRTEREQKVVRTSMEAMVEHDRKRRRNRWTFYGAVALGVILGLPLLFIYFAFLIRVASWVAG